MKKTLLFLIITEIFGTVQAQNSAPVNPKFVSLSPAQLAQFKHRINRVYENPSASQPSNSSAKRPGRIGNEPTLPFLGSSANVNSVRDATTTQITDNQACNLIVMTHRDNNSNAATCGTGAYVPAFSKDTGKTWDTTIYAFCNPAVDPGARYPNGVLFNPAGNNNPDNVYAVFAGPWTNGLVSDGPLGGWTQTVYGSVTIGNTNNHGMYWANGAPGVGTQNTGDLSFMSSSDDSTVHVIGQGYAQNAAQTEDTAWLGAVLTTGKFDAITDSFKWWQTIFRPHLVPGIKGFATMSIPYDSGLGLSPLADPGTAWSQDGKTGYVVIFGNLDSVGFNYASYQPIVYKTTDAGATWAMMPPFNFSNIPSLTGHLLFTAQDSGVKVPLWNVFSQCRAGQSPAQGATDDYDLTVDENGNLHILGSVISAGYARPDSAYTLSYFYGTGYIYDVYTTSASGGWQARFIDSMQTFPCHVVNGYNIWTNTPGTNGSSVAFGARIQASRTIDGKKIFCTWVDDLTGAVLDSLVFPDVKGEAYNVTTNKSGPVHVFTNTGNNYFLSVADIVMTNGTPDTTYTIPCSIVYPQVLLTDGLSDGGEAVNYFYLGTVQYNDTLGSTAGITKIPSSGFSISPNYPNPFSNITQFNVNLTNESTVSIDVFNLYGQKVYSTSPQKMENGSHIMTINGSGWSPGVYLYRVTVDNQYVTNKMVVQ